MASTPIALALTVLLASPAAPLQKPLPTPPAPTPSGQAPRVNADAKLMAEFEQKVTAYSAMHRKLEATIPDLPKGATPQEIESHQMALAALITKQRAGASAGDIFSKDIRALFRRYLARVFSGPQGAELKATIMDENPGRIRLAVNSRYPESVPLVTVPPQVLQALPKLPEDLEYRFIADTLLLLDIHAFIIVDIIENAIPH